MVYRKRPFNKGSEVSVVADDEKDDDVSGIDLKEGYVDEGDDDSSEEETEDVDENDWSEEELESSDESDDEKEDDAGGESDSTIYSDELEWEVGSDQDDDEEVSDRGETSRSKNNGKSKRKDDVGEEINGESSGAPKEVGVEKETETSTYNEYENETDSSDEEDVRNTIGNIPVNWYDDYKHIGYDWDGKQIIKPDKGDQLDYFLKKMEDPDFWRSVTDPQTGQDVVLSDKDIEGIKRLEAQKIPDPSFDEYAPWVEWFSSQVLKMPLRKFPEHKRSFVPSRDEMRRVSKYVYALKMGWMKTRKAMLAKKRNEEKAGMKFYMLWSADDVPEEMRRIHHHIPAPKRRLPDHSESYNPPEEYLMNQTELKKWNRERKSLGNKKLHFVPQKYNSLREVPAYKRFIRERFMRCLDLYMCPRAIKMKLTIEPEDLVPQLPSPADLQPFPTAAAIIYKGHSDLVRTITVDPIGQFMASGSDDSTVKIWEISTGRCLRTIKVGGTVRSVAWNPNSKLPLLLVASDKDVFVFNTLLGSQALGEETDALLGTAPPQDKKTPERVSDAVSWEYISPGNPLWKDGLRIKQKHFKEVKQVSWHGKGDYFFTLMPEGQNRSVLVHQLSRGRSQLPFSKSRGLIQVALFHPIKPLFFVATQRNIRVYDLAKQEMTKKLTSGSRWISSMAIHSGGDNILVGTYDRKVLWFDLELSTRPYKTLSLHSQAVRGVAYHKRYPLFASTSDDKSVIVSHGMVYNDLLKNALIVPLKRLSSHSSVNDFSVFDVVFHPYQPWVFSSGADGNVILYT